MTLFTHTPHAGHNRPHRSTAPEGPRSTLTRGRAALARLLALPLALVLVVATAPAPVAASPATKPAAKPRTSAAATPRKPNLDHSGRKQVGLASYYANKFSGRLMADGTPMRPGSNNAASRTLPLGTMAQVTNLKDGSTAVVTIRDRGPFVKGRIIDVSPHTARQLGFVKAGLVPVEVTPIRIPQPNGSVKSVFALADPDKADTRCAALSTAEKSLRTAFC